jgi:hypothetical protein
MKTRLETITYARDRLLTCKVHLPFFPLLSSPVCENGNDERYPHLCPIKVLSDGNTRILHLGLVPTIRLLQVSRSFPNSENTAKYIVL